MGSSQFHGFPTVWATGVDPDESLDTGVNVAWKIANPEAKIGRIEPSNITMLLNAANHFQKSFSRQGRLPLHLTQMWGATPPTGESLKIQERGIIAFVERAIKSFEPTWVGLMGLSLSLARNIERKSAIPIGATATPNWSPPYTPTIQEKREEAQALRESGIPEQYIQMKIWELTPEQAMGTNIANEGITEGEANDE
jgi:hypothetical protein